MTPRARDRVDQVPADAATQSHALTKAPTGIHGLDEITGGGLPRGRPTLVCGSAGCGKTLLAHGVPRPRRHRSSASPASSWPSRRPPRSWPQNVRSLGFDLDELVAQKKLSSSTTSTSSAARSRRPASTTSKGLFIRLGLRHRLDRRQAGRARHHRDALRRPVQRGDPPRRAAAAVPLAQGQGRHRRHHRRARRRARSPARAWRSTSPTA